MTITAKHPAFLNNVQRELHAVLGVHAPLYFAEVPAGAEALIGKKLTDSTITINGDYVLLIPLFGLVSTLKLYILAQLDSMTLTSADFTTLHLFDPLTVDVASAVALTGGTGEAAFVDNVLQTMTLTGMLGEQYARVTLTAGASPTSVTFDIASYTGI